MASAAGAPSVFPAHQLLFLLLALVFVPSAWACYSSNVGSATCSTAGCKLISGSYSELSSGEVSYNRQGQNTAGINYEWFGSLRPSASGPNGMSTAKPNDVDFLFLNQTSAVNVTDCCSQCGLYPGCQAFHYFPGGTTDLHQSLTNPTGAYTFTYPTPFPPDTDCGSKGYDNTDGNRRCILSSVNTTVWKYPDGTDCSSQKGAVAKCYPAVATSSGQTSAVVGPNYISGGSGSGSYVNSASYTVKGFSSSSGLSWFNGKPRSYFGASCNPKTNTSGTDDPHFVGGDGVRFDFNGKIGKSFCLITDTNVHINMALDGYLDDRTYGATVTSEGKAIRSWITQLNFIWKGMGGVQHSLQLSTRKGKQQDRGSGFVSAILLDKSAQTIPSQVGDRVSGQGVSFTLSALKKRGPFDMEEYSLEIVGVLRASVSVRVAHPLLQTTGEAYAHFNIVLNDFLPTPTIHGVLGQTLRQDGSRMNKVLEYKVLTSLLRGPIKADGESGVGYLEGSVDDYMTSDIATPDCKVTKFVG